MQTITQTFYAQALTASIDPNLCHQDVSFHVSHPVNDLSNLAEFETKFAKPLRTSMPDAERRCLIELQDIDTQGNGWIAATGHFVGTYQHAFLGMPANGRPMFMRFTEMVEIENMQIKSVYLLIDFLDMMNQLGCNPLRPSLGASEMIMAPADQNGLRDMSAPEQRERTIALVQSMLEELAKFDGESLLSMHLEDYWHPNFMWYGPAGIGTTRGIEGFRKHHQGPFVFAFPDRSIDHKMAFIAQGDFAATGGWPHMHGTHTGDTWLGLPASNKQVSLRVMDIWRQDSGLLVENWVGIDIIHILSQLGIDVFEQMQASANRN